MNNLRHNRGLRPVRIRPASVVACARIAVIAWAFLALISSRIAGFAAVIVDGPTVVRTRVRVSSGLPASPR